MFIPFFFSFQFNVTYIFLHNSSSLPVLVPVYTYHDFSHQEDCGKQGLIFDGELLTAGLEALLEPN